MSNFKADCRKFQPNIFNKTKCSNCFRQREEHSVEALECNRASRKVSKCGYLFVAPDWDFSNPLNRTKRWQRRWFVLYDDGELTYSVDDHPATIPQGVIDMNRVLEVSEAEDVTGNQFALAITSPDRATFIKGTCREESRWWFDVLSVFPRAHKQHGRYKRNATFPGIKTSSVLQNRVSQTRTPSPALDQTFDSCGSHRYRFHSCTTESLNVRPSSAPTLEGEEDVFPTKDILNSHSGPNRSLTSPPNASIIPPLYHSTPLSSLPPSARLLQDEQKENTPPYSQDYRDHPPTSESPPTQDKVSGHKSRARRTAKREAKSLSQTRNDVHQRQRILSDLEETKREEKLKDIADSITRLRTGSSRYYNKGEQTEEKPTREKDVPESSVMNSHVISTHATDSSTSNNEHSDPVSGLEGSAPYEPVSHLQRVDLPAEDILYIKKGWLMKQGLNHDFNKYWFVLRGSGLRFYRDPSAEDSGILDGIIDLGLVKNIEDCEVQRNYGFQITTWDDKKYAFSAVTSGIRTNWVQALRNAANLKDSSVNRPLTLGEKIEKEIANKDRTSSASSAYDPEKEHRSSLLLSPGESSYCMSSDEDYKSASEGTALNSTLNQSYESVRDGESRLSSTDSRAGPVKRSRSSPPISRKSTRDDFPSMNKLSSCNSESASLHSLKDLDVNQNGLEKVSSAGTLPSTGEGALVELLETQVESLKAKLEHTQVDELRLSLIEKQNEINGKESPLVRIEALKKQFQEERQEWQKRVAVEEKRVKELLNSQSQQEDLVRKLTRSLQDAEQRIRALQQEMQVLSKSASSYNHLSSDTECIAQLTADNADLTKQVNTLTEEVTKLKENLKSEKSEVYKWKDLVKELRSLLDGRNQDTERWREEHETLKDNLKLTQSELDNTTDKLKRGIEENEMLCSRLREMERQAQAVDKVRRASSTQSITSNRERFSVRRNIPRIGSLSDLTNFDMNIEPEELEKDSLAEVYHDLRLRFEKAVGEIKALKKEVREAQTLHDELELTNQCLKQEILDQKEDFKGQLSLMSSRVEDLTAKLSNSEKQVRLLKQKLGRTESKERRRTLSLKGKESFTLSKEIEEKLVQLESRVEILTQESDRSLLEISEGKADSLKLPLGCGAEHSRTMEDSSKSLRLRRKSLDNPQNSESIAAVVRISELEAKISTLGGEEHRKGPTLSGSSPATSHSLAPSSLQSADLLQNVKSPVASPLRSPQRSPSISRKTLKSPRSTPERSTRLTRSESETKALRERVHATDMILNTLHAKLSECAVWARSLSCTCACGGPTLSSLQKNLAQSVHIVRTRCSGKYAPHISKLQPLTHKIYELLKDKTGLLMQKRHHLKSAGKWTKEAQLKCFAERLAYETVLLGHIAQTVQGAVKSSVYEGVMKLQDLIEAHRRLSFLEKKLANVDFDMEPQTPLEFYTSLLAEKLIVQAEIIGTNDISKSSSRQKVVSDTCRDLQKRLLEREQTLASVFLQYKDEKLHEIAVVMARETVNGTQPSHDDSVLLEELRLREAWVLAQDLINQELVNLEASQSLQRLSYLLTPGAETDPHLTDQPSLSSLDVLQTAAEESLRQEMEESVFILSNKYEALLAEYRSGNTAIINSVSANMEFVLEEFAAVVAQKAITDGQLALAAGEDPTSTVNEPPAAMEENKDLVGSATDVVASEAHLLMFLGSGDMSCENLVENALTQTEFSFLYNAVSSQCGYEVVGLQKACDQQMRINGSLQLGKVCASPASASDKDGDTDPSSSSIHRIPPSPKTKRRVESSIKLRRTPDASSGMASACKQCTDLKQELTKIRKGLEPKLKHHDAECKHCLEHIKNYQALEEEHKATVAALQSSHKAEIERLREQLRYDPPTRDSDDELTELKRRLCLLEEGYENQIALLKQQYEEALSHQPDVCEENHRQRYQLEIENLRGLCEKGLGAMENSHMRMIAELEEKHRRDMAALQAEKEQALAEETQATLAALDAMRKAHEAEVQREIAKFKEEFIRKMNSEQDIGAIRREHEKEMKEIKREIILLSEKYSGKCLESSALEGKVEILERQINEATREIYELESRNRHLVDQLNVHVAELQSESSKNAHSKLRMKESELTLKNEEIKRLKQQMHKQLHDAKRHTSVMRRN